MSEETRHTSKQAQIDSFTVRISENPENLEYIFKTYFIDFVAFNFTVPDWVMDVCNQTNGSNHYLVCSWNSQKRFRLIDT